MPATPKYITLAQELAKAMDHESIQSVKGNSIILRPHISGEFYPDPDDALYVVTIILVLHIGEYITIGMTSTDYETFERTGVVPVDKELPNAMLTVNHFHFG